MEAFFIIPTPHTVQASPGMYAIFVRYRADNRPGWRTSSMKIEPIPAASKNSPQQSSHHHREVDKIVFNLATSIIGNGNFESTVPAVFTTRIPRIVPTATFSK